MIGKFFILGIRLYKSLLQYSNSMHIIYFQIYITKLLLHVSVCNTPSSGRTSYTFSELPGFHKNFTKDMLYSIHCIIILWMNNVFTMIKTMYSSRIKNQPDATNYFIVLLIGSKCFGHYYAHHQKLATMLLIITLVLSFLVCYVLEVRCG